MRDKKGWQKIFCVFLCILMVNPHVPVKAQGDGNPEKRVYLQSKMFYLTAFVPEGNTKPTMLDDEAAGDVFFSFKLSNDNHIIESSVRVEHPEIVQLEDVCEMTSPEAGDEACHGCGITCTSIRPGSTDILFQDKYGKEYAVRVVILPYENPLKSFKITNVQKGKNLASKFNKSNEYGTISGEETHMRKTTAHPKIRIKAKSNWAIKSIHVAHEWDEDNHGGKENYWRSASVTGMYRLTKTMTLKKICRGDWFYVSVLMKNRKTKKTIRLNFGNW